MTDSKRAPSESEENVHRHATPVDDSPGAASEPLKGDEGAQQVVREHGGCGEFMPNNRICILPQGHEQPHGEPAASDDQPEVGDTVRLNDTGSLEWTVVAIPAASDDLFTDDDVTLFMAEANTYGSLAREAVERGMAAVAPSIAAHALRKAADDMRAGRQDSLSSARAVLSAVDLSDHDRAVAVHALREAADAVDEGAWTEVGDISGWLRARAEAVSGDEHPDAEFLAHHPEWKV